METVTFIISLIAFGLSLYNFLENLINNIKKVALNIYEIKEYIFNDKIVYQAFINVSNKSNLSISITHLVANNLPCKIQPTMVSENIRRQGNEIISREVTNTMPFPLNLSPLMSQSGYIEFVSRDKTPIDMYNLTFDVYTNRGKISSITPTYVNCKNIQNN